MLSIPHMIVVFVVVLVLFGPQKLPELARGLGKLMAEFRKASLDFRNAFEEEMRDMERQTLLAERKKAAEAAVAPAPPALSQPATLTSPSGTESATTEAKPDGSATEAPVIAPVAEAVARSSEEPAEVTTEPAPAADGGQESHQEPQPPA
jgi:sec-independent protein translocase protein TatB